MLPLALPASWGALCLLPQGTVTMRPARGGGVGPGPAEALGRGEGRLSTAVVGVGLDGKHGLQKTMMPDSGLLQLVEKHTFWCFSFFSL